MPTSYFTGFDVIKRDVNGTIVHQSGVVVDVYNVTDSASLGTLTADSHGVISSRSLSIAVGKIIKFSVSGYTPFLERTTTASTPEYLGVKELALLIDDAFTTTLQTTAYNELWVKEGESNPKLIGTVEPGGVLFHPYNPATDANLTFYAIAKTDKGIAHVFDLQSAVILNYAPNRETGTPDFSQDGASANTIINFMATGYSVAKFRKIIWASDSGFTSIIDQRIDGNLNAALSPNFSITRSTSLSSAQTIYVKISHSTNNQSFDLFTTGKAFTFPDNMGAGGSSGGTPPSGIEGFLAGNTVYLNWTDGSGTNTVYRNGSPLSSASGSFTDTPDIGYNEYYVSNADGSTDTVSFYYSGLEF